MACGKVIFYSNPGFLLPILKNRIHQHNINSAGNSILLVFFLLFISYSSSAKKLTDEELPHVNQIVGFSENKGQVLNVNGKPESSVLYKGSFQGMTIYITERGLTYAFNKTNGLNTVKDQNKNQPLQNLSCQIAQIEMVLSGASIIKEHIVQEGESTENCSYFLSSGAAGISDIKRYSKITIKSVYPNIDWVIYDDSKQGIKYDFIVRPGGDPSMISLIYKNEFPLEIDDLGNLNIKTRLGTLVEKAPFSYFKESNKVVDCKFTQSKINQHEFEIKFKTRLKGRVQETLVLDPQLVWSTFLGDTLFSTPRSTCTDANGNLFITGVSYGGLPLLNSGTYFSTWNDQADIFVSKFSNTGVLLWSTYYGGSGGDSGFSIKSDASGNVFVAGESSSTDLPTVNAGTYYKAVLSGFTDMVFLKFSNTGNLLWATYFGGTEPGKEKVSDIAVDGSGNLFFVGTSDATDFPTLNAGTFYSATNFGFEDAVIGKFSNTGLLQWSTYFGGSNTDHGSSIAIDNMSRVYITGNTFSSDFIVSNSGGFFSGTLGGVSDAYFTLFSGTGSLLWSTYYGGSVVPWVMAGVPVEDMGISLVTDASNNVFCIGGTFCNDIPLSNPGMGSYYNGVFNNGVMPPFPIGMPPPVGGIDLFLLKFSPTQTLLWGTYFGGTDYEDICFDGMFERNSDNLAIDPCGNLYLSFGTCSNDIPLLNGGSLYFNGTYSGGTPGMFQAGDQALVKFNNSGTLLWSTYLGMDATCIFGSSPVSVNNNALYVAGYNTFDGTSANIPTVNPGGGAYFDGVPAPAPISSNMVLYKFNPQSNTNTLQATIAFTPATCSCNGMATVNVSVGIAPYSYTWSNGQTGSVVTNLCPGTLTVIVKDSDCPLPSTQILTLTLPGSDGLIQATINTLSSQCGLANGSATINATGGAVPYTYQLTPSTGIPVGSVITSLPGGNYTVTITDSYGCSVTRTFTIQNISPAVVTTSLISNVTCFGMSDGSAVAYANSGAPPYSFLWSNGQPMALANGLSAGIHTVLVTDANLCQSTATITISQPVDLLITAPQSFSLCYGLSTSLYGNVTGGTPPYSFLWNTSQTTPSIMINPTVATNYTLAVKDHNSCKKTKTFTVSVLPNNPLTLSINGGTICSGQSIVLTAYGAGGGGVGYDYLWSNGQRGSSISVNPSITTNYSVILKDICGNTTTRNALITVHSPPQVSIQGTTTICEGERTKLKVLGGGTHVWNNGDTSTVIHVSPINNTLFSVTSTSNGCSNSASLGINVTKINVELGPPIDLCDTGPVVLKASNSGERYLWNTGDTIQTIKVEDQGMYYVNVTYKGCNKMDYILVTGDIYGETNFYVPNAFSPNGDGLNDCFSPVGVNITELNLEIYNRWGNLVYKTQDLNNHCWDGKYKNEVAMDGIYVWVLRYKTLCTKAKLIEKTGHILLLK